MKFDNIMMKTAKLWSEMSYCKRNKVGAVLSSKDGRILATGFNGTISGLPNICEEYEIFKNESEIKEDNQITCPNCKGIGLVVRGYYNDDPIEDKCDFCNGFGILKILNKTNEFTLHAEQNIITYCAKNGIKTKDTILYVTHSPCKTCAKLIAQSGIGEVVYDEEYRDKEGIEFLKKVGIKIRRNK